MEKKIENGIQSVYDAFRELKINVKRGLDERGGELPISYDYSDEDFSKGEYMDLAPVGDDKMYSFVVSGIRLNKVKDVEIYNKDEEKWVDISDFDIVSQMQVFELIVWNPNV